MRFEEDKHTVCMKTVQVNGGTEIRIAVRFGSSRWKSGSQTYDGAQGWFCAYIIMKDADFDRISDKLPFRDGFPELDVPGGTSYFSRDPLFDEADDNPGYTAIGWDYDHDEPYEKDVTLNTVIDDAYKAVRSLSELLVHRTADRPVDSVPEDISVASGVHRIKHQLAVVASVQCHGRPIPPITRPERGSLVCFRYR